MSESKSTPAAASWRDLYPVHPCADVFPMMSDAELDALAQDIEAHGLQKPIVRWRAEDDSDAERCGILDGRNRLAALARLGVTFTPKNDEAVFPDGHRARVFAWNHTADPAAFVISANIRRRHLTKEQQAELIVRTLEAGQPNDRANVARSFSPTAGERGGSTEDPVLAAAITEGEKHDISKRTIQRARAKVNGRTPKSTIEPTVTRPPMPSTYVWVDEKNTQLRKQVETAVTSILNALAGYAELMTEPRFETPERQIARHRFNTDIRRISARVEHVFGHPVQRKGRSETRPSTTTTPLEGQGAHESIR
jgi:ParB-like nuclease domain